MALMPEAWLKKANKKANNMGNLYFPEKNSPILAPSVTSEACMSAKEASTVFGLIAAKTALASAIFPSFTTNHLGLRGTFNIININRKAGIASIPNIHRQAFSPPTPILLI